jgi:polysaccharide biosynthesis protein PslG
MRLARAMTAVLLHSFAATALAAGDRLPDLTLPEGLGINIHFTGNPRDLDLIAEAGFRFVRMDLAWAAIERQKGIYDFEKTGYDELTAGCEKRNIRILYILCYDNRLYEAERSVRTEEGRKAFAALAAAAARRYAGKRILWEIWNEPNIKQFWVTQPDVENYCRLAEATSAAIKQADPNALVVAPATSGIPFGWLEDCFKLGLLNWVDALSVHPYRIQPPETVISEYGRLVELVARHAPQGRRIPVLSGEWGYSLINWDNSRISEAQQGQYLPRMFLTNLAQAIPLSIWYDWKDDGTDPNEREHHFGIVTHDLQPKQAYLAAKTLTTTLAGFIVKERLNLGSDRDFVLRLAKESSEAIAFWTTADSHDVTLPLKAGKGTIVGLLGAKTDTSWTTAGPKVALSQSPQYLITESRVRK